MSSAPLDLLPTLTGAVLLLFVLACAIIRPRGLPEAVWAVPAALVALVAGLVPWEQATRTVSDLGPTLGFLAAILVLARVADLDGVFRWLGAMLARTGRGSAKRLLTAVFLAASVTTATLSLDATVVLLTPVILLTARRMRVPAAPTVYASAHLSNSASLLLPVSNLTNLLAYAAAGVSFLGFTALMVVPWLVAIATEYLVFRRFFRTGLSVTTEPVQAGPTPDRPTPTLVVLAVVLVGFALGPAAGVGPGLMAAIGAVLLGGRAVLAGRIALGRLLWSTNPLFLAFVAALSVVVDAATGHGLEQAITRLLPSGESLPALLAMAGIAALLANLVNNLPATLVLLATLGPHPATGLVLAMLIGVNIGPNLTYTGSLATLLWRRVLLGHESSSSLATFTRLGLLTVPACLAVATTALWCGLQLR